MKAALLGITICAASGDPGSLISFPCITSPTMATSLPITYFPAASPYVLGCGGTQPLSLQAPLEEEVVWNQLNQVLIIGSPATNFPAVGGSSGGGVSLLNPLPPYQEGSNVPETQVATLDDGVFTVRDTLRGRGVPDVAGFAHLNPGYAIQFKGKPAMAGGTSASTPMWAALIARINTALGKRVGFFQPSLYKHQFERKTLCKTIRLGGNGAYRAGAELWNPCTGLGTPNGEEIVKALKRG
jgi:kumamolisin